MINEKRLLDSFLEYVQIDSETLNEKNMSLRVKKELEDIGFEVEIDNVGEMIGGNTGNVFAKLKGDSSLETIMFSAHMDTVKPGIGVKPIVEEGIIKTSGDTILGADDKCGIAAIIEAVRSIKENNVNHPDIEILFTVAEEGGLKGAKNFDYDKSSTKRAIIIDSGGAPGTVITSAPGQIKYEIEIIGKSAHAGGAPEKGISAILVAADAITNMKLLRIDEETTANIGSIYAEYATNIVPAKAVFKGEIRSRNNEKLDKIYEETMEVIKTACEKYGATHEKIVEKSYDGYVHDENNDFVKYIKNSCENLGLKVDFVGSGGGSDANCMVKKGITAVNIGCGMAKVHTLEENLAVADLVMTSNLVYELIEGN